jgi:hypothetical protein
MRSIRRPQRLLSRSTHSAILTYTVKPSLYTSLFPLTQTRSFELTYDESSHIRLRFAPLAGMLIQEGIPLHTRMRSVGDYLYKQRAPGLK